MLYIYKFVTNILNIQLTFQKQYSQRILAYVASIVAASQHKKWVIAWTIMLVAQHSESFVWVCQGTLYIVYNVQYGSMQHYETCAIYIVQCTVHTVNSVHCTAMYRACMAYGARRTLCCTSYSICTIHLYVRCVRYVHLRVYNVYCIMYDIQCTKYIIRCALQYTVQRTLYSVQYTDYGVQCTMYTVHMYHIPLIELCSI